MTNDSDLTQPEQTETAVGRRALFRGGAALAGAAGISVVGASLMAGPAEAADGDSLKIGTDNEAAATTSLTIAGMSTTAANANGLPTALALTNESGPSLYLNPLPANWNGSLATGQILNTTRGPLIGIDGQNETVTASLLTEQDVWWPIALSPPLRLVDTRTAEGRMRVTLPNPLTSDGRLKANTEMTIALGVTEGGEQFGIPALHINLTVVKPKAHGYAVAYPGPDRSDTSTVNFTKNRTVANSAFVGTSSGTYRLRFNPNEPPEELELIVIKVFTTTAAWIVVDLTGAYATGINPVGNATSAKRLSPVSRAQRALRKLG